MHCKMGSQATTYCSEVEAGRDRYEKSFFEDAFKLRRSQRLQDKWVAKHPHTGVGESSFENCIEPTYNVDMASSPASVLFQYNTYDEKPQSENLFESEAQTDLLPPAQVNSVLGTFPELPIKKHDGVPVKKRRNRKVHNRPPKLTAYKRKSRTLTQPPDRQRKCVKEVQKASTLTENVKTKSRTKKSAIPAKCSALSTDCIENNFIAELQGAPIERYNVLPNVHQTQAVPLAESVLPNCYPAHFKDQLPRQNAAIEEENAQPHNNLDTKEAIMAKFQAEYQRIFWAHQQQEQAQKQLLSRQTELHNGIETVGIPLAQECHTSLLNKEILHQKHQQQQSQQLQATSHELQLSDELDTCSPSVTHDQLTTPSQSDSLHAVFGTNNLRDVLKIDPILYKLTDGQLTAAAYILNIEVPRLRGVIKMVQRLPADEIICIAADFSAANLHLPKSENIEKDEHDSAFSMQLIENSQSPE